MPSNESKTIARVGRYATLCVVGLQEQSSFSDSKSPVIPKDYPKLHADSRMKIFYLSNGDDLAKLAPPSKKKDLLNCQT
jgi:hypothetical protein